MISVTIPRELIQQIEYEEIVRKHERKAKRVLIAQRVKEIMSEGVDKEMAKIIANAEWNACL